MFLMCVWVRFVRLEIFDLIKIGVNLDVEFPSKESHLVDKLEFGAIFASGVKSKCFSKISQNFRTPYPFYKNFQTPYFLPNDFHFP